MTQPSAGAPGNPPPLTAAASLATVQAVVLLILAVLESANLEDDRRSLGLSTTVFFAAYGVVLLAAAWGLYRRAGWSRGPVLITQLIMLGLAWNLREHVLVAVVLVGCALIVLAGMLHPDTIEALDGDDQPSDSSD